MWRKGTYAQLSAYGRFGVPPVLCVCLGDEAVTEEEFVNAR